MTNSYAIPGSRGSILVLDDEDSVRKLACRILEEAGYDVRGAATGEEAVKIAENMPGLSLLVSDVVLPGMGAAAAWHAISMICHDARVLFTSGYTGEQLASQALLSTRTPLLGKPFSAATFLAAVQSAIAVESTGLRPETP